MAHDYAVVFGAPRSGTTFLMDVLDALPEAECVTGNMFPIPIAHLAAQPLPDETRQLLERSLRSVFRDYLESGIYRSRAGALRKWWVAGRRLRDLAGAARGTRRERMLIYKEPFLAFSPDLVFDALPGSRLIHLVRDGRDVADSLVRSYDVLSDRALAGLETNEVPIGRRHDSIFVPWWVEVGKEEAFASADQYVRAIWMWREMASRCQAFLAREDVGASGRVLTVKYERLMTDPVGEGHRIVEHLGLDTTAIVEKRLREAHSRSFGIHSGRTAEAIREAEAVAGPQLGAFGYELRGQAEAADLAEPAVR
jgi:hypothetical protein